jgi:hypothetical protein
MRIGMLTGGGDAPGLNAAIRAVVRVAHRAGHRTSGIRNGWAGVLEGRIEELLPRNVRGILPLGGTILGTSRTNPLKEPDGLERAIGQLARPWRRRARRDGRRRHAVRRGGPPRGRLPGRRRPQGDRAPRPRLLG